MLLILYPEILSLVISVCIERYENWCIHSLKCYFSTTKWDRNTICVMFHSLNFLKLVHVHYAHLLPEYTFNNDVEESDLPSELLLIIFELTKFDEHWISRYKSHENVASITSLGIVQKPAWLHQCSLSSAPTFQHVLHRLIDFKHVSDSCYCYPCWWWCIKFNPPTSLNFNNILHFPVTLQ